MKKSNSIAWKITGKLCLWMLILVVGVSVFFFNFTLKTMSALYAENFHNKMLITYEYTRRVLSDVYVSVTNNIFYIENSLDKPDGHIDVMERIVRHGTPFIVVVSTLLQTTIHKKDISIVPSHGETLLIVRK